MILSSFWLIWSNPGEEEDEANDLEEGRSLFRKQLLQSTGLFSLGLKGTSQRSLHLAQVALNILLSDDPAKSLRSNRSELCPSKREEFSRLNRGARSSVDLPPLLPDLRSRLNGFINNL